MENQTAAYGGDEVQRLTRHNEADQWQGNGDDDACWFGQLVWGWVLWGKHLKLSNLTINLNLVKIDKQVLYV